MYYWTTICTRTALYKSVQYLPTSYTPPSTTYTAPPLHFGHLLHRSHPRHAFPNFPAPQHTLSLLPQLEKDYPLQASSTLSSQWARQFLVVSTWSPCAAWPPVVAPAVSSTVIVTSGSVAMATVPILSMREDGGSEPSLTDRMASARTSRRGNARTARRNSVRHNQSSRHHESHVRCVRSRRARHGHCQALTRPCRSAPGSCRYRPEQGERRAKRRAHDSVRRECAGCEDRVCI